MPAPKKKEETIRVTEVVQGEIEACIIGRTPLIVNRLSEKAKRELMMPAIKKSRAGLAATLKHVPIEEYRASLHQLHQGPTAIGAPCIWFKSVIRDVALDLPETKAAQIGRLSYVPGHMTPIYGTPQLFIAPVRQGSFPKTPDMRTRAIIPNWGCRITITFVKPILTEQTVVNLLAAGGIMRGVGDWRPQKGSGDYGQFEVVSEDDPRFLDLVENHGRIQQLAAIEDPECYDHESAELLAWFNEEVERRGREEQAGKPARSKGSKAQDQAAA